MNFQEFADKHNITLTATKTDHNPNMLDFKGDHWRVKLTYPAPHYYAGPDNMDVIERIELSNHSLHYSKGYGHKGAPPTVDEVLNCLHSDATIIESYPTFEGFCSELGYDVDSRKAEKTYEATQQQTEEVQAWLGDLYDEFLSCEED